MIKQIFLILLCLGIISKDVSFAASESETLMATVPIEVQFLEATTVDEINRIRLEKGLNPLQTTPLLAECARIHSQNMATKKCHFGHDGFVQRASKLEKLGHYHYVAENVAFSSNYSDPVKVAVNGWMKSSGHRKHILGDYKETGVGLAVDKDNKFFFTQLFAK